MVAVPKIVGVHRVFIRRRLEFVAGLLRARMPRYLAEAAAYDLVVDGCQLTQRARSVPPSGPIDFCETVADKMAP